MSSWSLMEVCGPLGPGPLAVDGTDFAPCFSSLVLDSIPLALLAVYIWPQTQAIYRRRRFFSTNDRSASYRIRVTSCITMATLPIISLIVHSVSVDNSNLYTYIYPYELIAQLGQLIAWLCGTFLVALSNMHGTSLHFGIRLWWILNFLISAKDLESQAFRAAHAYALVNLLIVNCFRLFFSLVLAVDSLMHFNFPIALPRTTPGGELDIHTQLLGLASDEEEPQMNTDLDRDIWDAWISNTQSPSSARYSFFKHGSRIQNLHVISWFEGTDSKGSSYVQFSIEVESFDEKQAIWMFSCQFIELLWLKDALKKAHISSGIPFALPEFPQSLNDKPVAEIAAIVQQYLQSALTFESLQMKLEALAGSPSNIQQQPVRGSDRTAASNQIASLGILSPRAIVHPAEHKHFSVRQKLNEVITNPIGAILDRKIRPLPEEVIRFQNDITHFKITAVHILNFNNSNNTTTYNIDVNTVATKWTITRRFKQFQELHSKLLRLFDDRLLPTVPSRSILYSFHHLEFLEHRRRQLDIYLQSLVNSDYFECVPLYDFLTDKTERIQHLERHMNCETDSVLDAEEVHKFEIALTKWQYSDPDDNRSEPLYFFEVYEFFSSNQFLKWTLTCTLFEFKKLHAALRSRFPTDDIPELPKLSLTQTSADPLIANDQAAQLEIFLQKLINCTPLSCPEVNTFLELDNASRNVSTGMHSADLP